MGGRAVEQVTALRGSKPAWTNDGDGYGYGYGYGYGDGYGYGYGYGYGDGYGDGYGHGYGYGDGDGHGYGDGYGYGYGDGSKAYWLATIPYFAAKWNAAQQEKLRAAQDAGLQLAFWRSDKNGQPANRGGPIEAAAPGVVHTTSGPLNLCNPGTLHATLLPPKWQGERCWIVALHGEVVGDEEKYGCLKREILGEAL
jgi:hypothetical protein